MKKKKTKKTSKKLPKSQYKQEEWEWPEDAEKKGDKWPAEIRKKYIAELFGRGIIDPNKQNLAALMGVSRRQIHTDFQDVFASGISLKEAKTAESILGNSLKNAVIETSDIIVTSNKDKKVKLQAIKTLGEIAEKYTNFLEKFDIKKPGEVDQTDNEIIISWLPPGSTKRTK